MNWHIKDARFIFCTIEKNETEQITHFGIVIIFWLFVVCIVVFFGWPNNDVISMNYTCTEKLWSYFFTLFCLSYVFDYKPIVSETRCILNLECLNFQKWMTLKMLITVEYINMSFYNYILEERKILCKYMSFFKNLFSFSIFNQFSQWFECILVC